MYTYMVHDDIGTIRAVSFNMLIVQAQKSRNEESTL